MTVCLTWAECHLAVWCGTMRYVQSARQGWVPVGGLDPCLEVNALGAAAEMAVAKALNQYFRAGVNTPNDPDVGHAIEVRSTERPDGNLLIRPTDDDYRRFVLARGKMPKYELIGWFLGADGKREEWKRTTPKDYYYLVPAGMLRPIEELIHESRSGGAPASLNNRPANNME